MTDLEQRLQDTAESLAYLCHEAADALAAIREVVENGGHLTVYDLTDAILVALGRNDAWDEHMKNEGHDDEPPDMPK